MGYEREEGVALRAVAEAAALCERVRARDVAEAVSKADRSPVTLADYGAQALVCRRLSLELPGDAVLAEEDAAALASSEQGSLLARAAEHVGARLQAQDEPPPADAETVRSWIALGGSAPASRFWTLDPIDGTKGFLRGDQYAVALALIVEGRVEVAALACPALVFQQSAPGLLLSARRGHGATYRRRGGEAGTVTRVAVAEDRGAARMVESVEAAHGDRERQEAIARAAGLETAPLRMDSQAKYAAIALGMASLYLRLPSPRSPDYREKIWDHAAGALIVEEAGGRVSDMRGQSLDFGHGRTLANNRGVVASQGRLHDAVLAALEG